MPTNAISEAAIAAYRARLDFHGAAVQYAIATGDDKMSPATDNQLAYWDEHVQPKMRLTTEAENARDEVIARVTGLPTVNDLYRLVRP